MTYEAWSDGSIKEANSYVSYIIVDENEKVVDQFKAKILGVKYSVETEYVGFYLLLKRIIEMNLIDINIFCDCLPVVNDFLNGSKTKFPYPFRKHTLNLLNESTYEIKGKFNWKSRKYNKAHPLFGKRIESENCIELEVKDILNPLSNKSRKRSEFDLILGENEKKLINGMCDPLQEKKSSFKEKTKFKQEKEKIPLSEVINFLKTDKNVEKKIHLSEAINFVQIKKIEGNEVSFSEAVNKLQTMAEKAATPQVMNRIKNDDVLPVPNTKYYAKTEVINRWSKEISTDKYDTVDKKLDLLNKKIKKAMFFEENNGVQLFVKGRLHIYFRNNIIFDIKMRTSLFSEIWKEKHPEKINLMVLKKAKNRPEGNYFKVPNTPVLIEEKLLFKIQNKVFSSKPMTNEQALELISDRIRNGLKVNENGYTIYVTGKFHLFVAYNLVQDCKTSNSEWSKRSKIAKCEILS